MVTWRGNGEAANVSVPLLQLVAPPRKVSTRFGRTLVIEARRGGRGVFVPPPPDDDDDDDRLETAEGSKENPYRQDRGGEQPPHHHHHEQSSSSASSSVSSSSSPNTSSSTNNKPEKVVLGFKIDPPPLLDSIQTEITALYAAATKDPTFGVSLPPPTEKSAAHEAQGRASRGSGCSGDGSGKDEVDTDAAAAAATRLLAAMGPPGWGGALSSSAVALLDDEDGDALDASAYFADPLKERDRPVVFDDHLGLAVETCVGGYTCETLWDALIIS